MVSEQCSPRALGCACSRVRLVLARPARNARLRAVLPMQLFGRDRGRTVLPLGRSHHPGRRRRRGRDGGLPSLVAEHRVDGVLVKDLRIVDPRVEQIEQLGSRPSSSAVLRVPAASRPVWSDDAGAVVEVVRYLARLGHERIARVAGVPEFLHTEIRTEAFLATMAELSLSSQVLTTDYMAESGAQVTRQLLSDRRPPTAIVYDNDVLAVAGLGVAHEMGLSVPRDVSLVGWDDSLYTQAVHPRSPR